MKSLTITGLLVGIVVLLAASPPSADNGPDWWPNTTGNPVIEEWYSDIPWTQKLGTFRGNEIDEPIVLPFEALGQDEKADCKTHNLTDEACMLELGINNVLGTLRIDTLYNDQHNLIKKAEYCKNQDHPNNPPCIEVKLELSSFWTRSKRSARG